MIDEDKKPNQILAKFSEEIRNVRMTQSVGLYTAKEIAMRNLIEDAIEQGRNSSSPTEQLGIIFDILEAMHDRE